MRTRGFTLIELSLVLVIIGLIVGGIMVGRDLITAAKLRSQIAQFDQYQTAFNTFQGKYNCLPGDCNNVTSFLGTTDSFGNTITNGNANGQLDDSIQASYVNNSFQSFANSPELGGAFQEMAMAKLIDFVPRDPTSYALGVSHPRSKLSDMGGFFIGASYFFTGNRTPMMASYQAGNNLLWYTQCDYGNYLDVSAVGCGIFMPADLAAIDRKIDDGKPLSGRLFGFSSYSGAHTQCVASSAYNISYASAECQAAYIVN